MVDWDLHYDEIHETGGNVNVLTFLMRQKCFEESSIIECFPFVLCKYVGPGLPNKEISWEKNPIGTSETCIQGRQVESLKCFA